MSSCHRANQTRPPLTCLRLRFAAANICILPLVMLSVMRTADPAAAQVADQRLFVGPLLELTFPFGDMDDVATSGYGLGPTFDAMIDDNLAIGGTFSFMTFDAQAPRLSDPQLHRLGMHGKLYIEPYSPNTLFIEGGVGTYYHRRLLAKRPNETWKLHLGIHAGAGVVVRTYESQSFNFAGRVHKLLGTGETTWFFEFGIAMLFGTRR
jgi:hypothetical protein